MKITSVLLQARAEQLLRREGVLDKAHREIMKARSETVRYWDQRIAQTLRKKTTSSGVLSLGA